MKIIAAFFAAVIIVIIFLADANKLPGFLHAIYNIPCGDKVGHFALFGMFCYLSTRAAIASLAYRAPKRVTLSTGLVLAMLIALEEYSQRFFPSRTSDWWDLFASLLGVALGGWWAYSRTKKL